MLMMQGQFAESTKQSMGMPPMSALGRHCAGRIKPVARPLDGPLYLAFPLTSKGATGEVVPMPTYHAICDTDSGGSVSLQFAIIEVIIAGDMHLFTWSRVTQNLVFDWFFLQKLK